MTRLLLDMCVDRRLVGDMESLGYNTVHVAALGMATASDAGIMAFALDEGRVVVTHDSDFAQILAQSRARSPSVIRLRMPTAQYTELSAVLASALPLIGGDLDAGCVASISERGVRVHLLPIGNRGAEVETAVDPPPEKPQ